MNDEEQRDEIQTTTSESKSGIAGLSKDAIFWISVIYVLLAIVLLLLYQLNLLGIEEGQFSIPPSIPWFGTVGAITVSLQAIFERRGDQWDSTYNYWHLGRPLIGAVLGIMSFMILSVIVTLAGSTPPSPAAAPNVMNVTIFEVLAFIVGYREETFRHLLKRVTDLILQPAVVEDRRDN